MATSRGAAARRRAAAWACCALALAGPARAQPAPGPAAAASAAATAPLKTALVRTGLYVITGGGSNTLLRFSAQGSILVDGQAAGQYRALMSQVRRTSRLSDLPVRVLVLTDHHSHHAGTNAQFASAGVPLIAQANARSRLAAEPPAAGKATPPFITFENRHPLRFGGVAVDLLHFGPGHTDNDTVVHFPDLKVVAVGDLFTAAAPEPDFAAGGSLVGWAAALAEVLKLDFDLVVPAVGPVVGRAELQSLKDRIDSLVQRARALLDQGVGKQALLARLQADDLGWQLSPGGAQLDGLYADLSRGR